jgi:hypothetical protein
MNHIPQALTQEAKERFLSTNRDLIALIKNANQEQLFTKIAAAMQLNPQFTEEVMLHADVLYLNQKGHAGKIAREEFSRAIYASMCRSFLKVQRNCAFEFACRLTPEALAQLEAIEVAAGERQPAPPPPPRKSARELLVEQVREDWKRLPTDKLRAKLNRDPEYKKVFDELMGSNQLESVATAYTDGSAEFRQ